ncbi:GNAT family N-acetyltransferase [Actinorhabdospora filicis]|nr:GNAT family N-acetyltransferase [Actinorhabdospora filicis]
MHLTWTALTAEDFPLLGEWLRRPHVHEWWNHETDDYYLERDFGPVMRGEEPSEDLLVRRYGTPVGLVQRSRFGDYPEYRDEIAALTEVPKGAVALDYLVGEEEDPGHVLGAAMVRAVVEATWTDVEGAECVIVPVAVANRASWEALELAGLRRVAEGTLRPDNSAFGEPHYVYRADRP